MKKGDLVCLWRASVISLDRSPIPSSLYDANPFWMSHNARYLREARQGEMGIVLKSDPDTATLKIITDSGTIAHVYETQVSAVP
jgi:hypothetical protein